MSDSYYISSDGQEFGPVSLADVDRLLRDGIVQPSDRIRASSGQWVTIPEWRTRRQSTARPASTVSTPPPASVWWVADPGGPVGPLTTDQFLESVQSGRVTPESLVQVPGTAEWIAAGTIPELPFPRDSTDTEASSPPSTAAEMRRLFAECARQQSTRHAHARPAPHIVSTQNNTVSMQWLVQGILRVPAALAAPVFALLKVLLIPLLPLIRSRVAWGMVGVTALAGAGVWIASQWTTQTLALAQLSDLWEEYRSAKSTAGDSADWTEFKSRAEVELAELTPRLARSARSEDRVSILLLWISRDYLPQVLKDPENERRTEEQLEAHFQTIRKTMGGQSGGSVPLDLLTVSIIALDVVGLAALGWYFRKSIFPV